MKERKLLILILFVLHWVPPVFQNMITSDSTYTHISLNIFMREYKNMKAAVSMEDVKKFE